MDQLTPLSKIEVHLFLSPLITFTILNYQNGDLDLCNETSQHYFRNTIESAGVSLFFNYIFNKVHKKYSARSILVDFAKLSNDAETDSLFAVPYAELLQA